MQENQKGKIILLITRDVNLDSGSDSPSNVVNTRYSTSPSNFPRGTSLVSICFGYFVRD